MKLPDALKNLAKADVKAMTPSLDPSNLSPEAVMATLWVTVQETRREVEEIRDTVKWIIRLVIGCLVTAFGGLITAVIHLATYVLTTMGHK